MAATVTTPQMSTEGKVILTNKKFYREDFSGRNMDHADLRCGSFIECNFDKASLRYANCEGANFFGSSFKGSNLYRTNMKDAILERTKFFPKECFGITLTLKCETFKDMEIEPTWLLCWMFFPSLMNVPEKVLDKLIQFIGPDRYIRFKAVFNRRVI
jgi:hypothetical protein